jgi:LuxR family quorum-sensing system transcriptional regulator CciR
MIQLTQGDLEVLSQARRFGIGDGFTVPAHVPGEYNGSCSFAVTEEGELPREHRLVAQLVGGLAFEAARRIAQPRRAPQPTMPMTDRQRDCVLWAARGKTDWEISRILGVSHETVIQHLKHARERYGVQKRAHLAVMALFDGTICFSDIFIH